MANENEEARKRIGQGVREFFKKKRIKQQEAAEMLGVSPAYVSKVCRGKCGFSPENAKEWSNQFGLSTTFLLTGEGSVENTTEVDAPPTVSKEHLSKLTKDELISLVFKAFELANKHIEICNRVIQQNSSIVESNKDLTMEMIKLCGIAEGGV